MKVGWSADYLPKSREWGWDGTFWGLAGRSRRWVAVVAVALAIYFQGQVGGPGPSIVSHQPRSRVPVLSLATETEAERGLRMTLGRPSWMS